MADRTLKSITFPGLPNRYVVPPISNTALEYSASSTYEVGDIVSYNRKIYRCTTAIINPEGFSPSHWIETTLGDEVKRLDDGKVDKVTGKQLSTEDYTAAEKTKLGALPTRSELDASLNSKVDKVTGKQLSTEDYTTAEKTKLAGIEEQANKTVIDDTLTESGQAADAKAAGDAIKTLNQQLSDLKDDLNEITDTTVLFSSASETVTGTKYANRVVYTVENPDVTSPYTFKIQSTSGVTNSSSCAYIRCYDSDGQQLSQTGVGLQTPISRTISPPSRTASIAFQLYASDNTPLSGDAVYSGVEVIKGTVAAVTISDSAVYPRLDADEQIIANNKDRIGNMSFSLSEQGIYTPMFFELGTVDSQTAADIPMSIRARAKGFIPVTAGDVLLTNSNALTGYSWSIIYCDSSKTPTSSVGFYNFSDSYTITSSGYIRMIVKKSIDAVFTQEDFSLLTNSITVLTKTAQNISEYGSQLGTIANDVGAVPQYWVNELNADIAKIQALDAKIGAGGDSFVFVTDTHVESNAMVSPRLINSILKQTAVQKVVHGGDIFQSDTTKSGAIAKMFSWFAAVSDVQKYYQVRGNHDINDSIDGVSSDEYLTDAEYYGVCLARRADEINDALFAPYYYYDNEHQKIRYFVLDTGSRTTQNVSTYFSGQLTWMEGKINELNDEWGIVVFLHIMCTPKLASDASALSLSDRGELLVAKLNSLYGRSGKPNIICVIAGHAHRDFSRMSDNVNDTGYPIIVTTCDTAGEIATTYDPVNVDRTLGTTNEQAFDVCHIDKTLKKIYMTRIGAGSDRTFDYDVT